MFGERHIHHVVNEYVEHYNLERPHKGLGYLRPIESDAPSPREGPVLYRKRLGGLLRSYHREVA